MTTRQQILRTVYENKDRLQAVFAQDEKTIDAVAREGLVFQEEVSDHVEDRTVEHVEALLDGLTEVTLNGARRS